MYFALAGASFGLLENILYGLENGAAVIVLRAVLVPFFHTATVKMKLSGKSQLQAYLALGVMMVLHALYDFCLSSGQIGLVLFGLALTMGLQISLFLFYKSAANLDVKRGLATAINNRFCRACGHPNKHGKIYCINCGKLA